LFAFSNPTLLDQYVGTARFYSDISWELLENLKTDRQVLESLRDSLLLSGNRGLRNALTFNHDWDQILAFKILGE
ncbi:MAG: hypothetical protein MN733_17765, partial [Nitrososphaera sp.]|nr:hypothetical protein [Nitrososphaera sp.]